MASTWLNLVESLLKSIRWVVAYPVAGNASKGMPWIVKFKCLEWKLCSAPLLSYRTAPLRLSGVPHSYSIGLPHSYIGGLGHSCFDGHGKRWKRLLAEDRMPLGASVFQDVRVGENVFAVSIQKNFSFFDVLETSSNFAFDAGRQGVTTGVTADMVCVEWWGNKLRCVL